MPKGPFAPSQFTETKWSTQQDKADFGNALLHFIGSGFKQALFTRKLYHRLSQTFGHIAHYVEFAIMRSFNAKAVWTHSSEAQSLCIIPCSERSMQTNLSFLLRRA